MQQYSRACFLFAWSCSLGLPLGLSRQNYVPFLHTSTLYLQHAILLFLSFPYRLGISLRDYFSSPSLWITSRVMDWSCISPNDTDRRRDPHKSGGPGGSGIFTSKFQGTTCDNMYTLIFLLACLCTRVHVRHTLLIHTVLV